jgi:hypothetical protein
MHALSRLAALGGRVHCPDDAQIEPREAELGRGAVASVAQRTAGSPRNELRRAGLISPAQSRVSASPRIRAKVLPRSVIQILAQPRQQVWLLTAGLSSRSAAHAIAEVNDAVSEPALFQEGERDADVVGQCALATTNDDRPEEQVQLVDQPRGDRLAG